MVQQQWSKSDLIRAILNFTQSSLFVTESSVNTLCLGLKLDKIKTLAPRYKNNLEQLLIALPFAVYNYDNKQKYKKIEGYRAVLEKLYQENDMPQEKLFDFLRKKYK